MQVRSKIILLGAIHILFAGSVIAKPLNIDTSASHIEWTGSKVTGTHTGKLDIKSGTVTFEDDKIVGGEFVFDMNAIKNEDLEDPEYKKKLEDHLKSDDFFSVSTHPEAKFVIDKVTPPSGDDKAHLVAGTLTIKGISHPISFNSEIENTDTQYVATGKVKFDRTKWDVKYNSGKFFSLAALGDKLIYDDIEVQLKVVAPKEKSE